MKWQIEIIILAIFLFLIASCVISSIYYDVTMIGGLSIVQVQTASMSASGIEPGDFCLLVRSGNYQVGDFIAFKSGNWIWFHEIYSITEDGLYITKGTSNPSPDMKPITDKQIIGKYVCTLSLLRSIIIRLIIIFIPYAARMTWLMWQLWGLLRDRKLKN